MGDSSVCKMTLMLAMTVATNPSLSSTNEFKAATKARCKVSSLTCVIGQASLTVLLFVYQETLNESNYPFLVFKELSYTNNMDKYK